MQISERGGMTVPAIQKVGKAVLFAAIVVSLLMVLSVVFRPKDNREEAGMEYPGANGILGEAPETVDLLMIGDSEAWAAFSPMQMWKERGISAYVCGTSGQQLYRSVGFLEQALEKQKPKVVVLETNTMFRDYHLDEMLGYQACRWFPVFQYHNRWKSLNRNDLSPDVTYTYRDDFKGYKFSTECVPSPENNYMKPNRRFEVISRKNRIMLHRIQNLCQEHGASLVLVSTPSTKNWNYARHNTVAFFAWQEDLPYIDLNLETGMLPIDWEKDTRDKGDHMNYWGAVKVSSYLAQKLQQQYGLADHRGDGRYRSWEDALQNYENTVERELERAD